MKRIGGALLWIIGLYFVARAAAEPFVIDLTDPATYHRDWGGPHLAGVLAVHCGPGIVAAALMVWALTPRPSRILRGPGAVPRPTTTRGSGNPGER